MNLAELLRGVEVRARGGPAAAWERALTGLHYDSRQIAPGFAFVAMKGESSDGSRYIDSALAHGAAAVVTDSSAHMPVNAAWAQVEHGRRALAQMSANFYGAPAARLALTGVTGTNGKTTTTFLLAQLLQRAGRGAPVLVGTVEYHYAGRVTPAPHTTPEALELNRIFAAATDPALGGYAAREAVMEVSSHALAQERVYGLRFDVAVFTNLSQDHLDYHGSMANYFAAKCKMFSGLGGPPPRVAVINSDDGYGRELAALSARAGSQVVSYGIESGTVRAEAIRLSAEGSEFEVRADSGAWRVRSPLVGRMNIYNLLATAAAALGRGVEGGAMAAALAHCRGAPGRFERVQCGQPFAVVVDYAHTEDALRNLTALARELMRSQPRPGRVLTLFGCGGDRDRGKRPLMARAAAEGSDFVALTSDNPRSEDAQAIIADALPGLRAGARYAVEPDRRSAIALVIGQARPGDIVLIAGKGHEKVQVTAQGAVAFDDVEVARAALEAAGYTAPASAGGVRR